jgi:hypothetical protein
VAEADRASGKDQQVFKDSDYMMGEDARTPNVHSRQVRPPVCAPGQTKASKGTLCLCPA